MTRPEGQTQSTAETVSPAGHETGNLDHGSVRRSIIHRSVVPGVDVTAKENEFVTSTNREGGDQDGCLAPTDLDLCVNPHSSLTLLNRRTDGNAALVGHREDWCTGKLGTFLRIRAPPDR